MILTEWFVDYLMDMPAKPESVVKAGMKKGFAEDAIRELAEHYGYRMSDRTWRFSRRRGVLTAIRKTEDETFTTSVYTRKSGWEVRRWLRNFLRGGGRWSNEIYAIGARYGYGPRMIRRALTALPVIVGPKVKMESGPGCRCLWKLKSGE